MNLTGKCKKEFEKWFMKSKTKYNFSINWLKAAKREDGISDPLSLFECAPPEMQYGVYVDFFDSVSIYIDHYLNNDGVYELKFNTRDERIIMWSDSIRHEARTAAIDKANEIFNLKTKDIE